MTGKGQLLALRTYWRTVRPSVNPKSRVALRHMRLIEYHLAYRAAKGNLR